MLAFHRKSFVYVLLVGMSIAPMPVFAVPASCVAQQGLGTITGHLALPPAPAFGAVRIFTSSQANDASLDVFRQLLKQESQSKADFASWKDQRIGQTQMSSLSGPSPIAVLNDILRDSKATIKRQMELAQRFFPMLASEPSVSIDQPGSFTCGGLKPGSYDILAEIQRTVPAPASIKQYVSVVNEKSFYVAQHVVVPKPNASKNKDLAVKVTRFTLLGRQ
jgi:hypothetical protein